ncbi:MAG TPA: hypothetical protein VN493_27380 [Thermoanaerobaculia bacterium]|nr:hypothetical protein [Thermoanaerobaculia bacterium]
MTQKKKPPAKKKKAPKAEKAPEEKIRTDPINPPGEGGKTTSTKMPKKKWPS